MTNRVWVLGDAVVDLVPDSEGRYLKCPGGAPANVAVGVARLAGNSAFIGRVGADPFGRFLHQVLTTEGVDTSHMRLDAHHATSTVVVDLDADGERSFSFLVRPSADLFLTPADLPTFHSQQWLHLCSIALSRQPSRDTALQAMQAMRSAGGYVSFDPNLRPDVWEDPTQIRPCVEAALRLADIAKLSEEELFWLTDSTELDSAMAQLMARFPLRYLFVTQGKDGVRVSTASSQCHVPCRPVSPLDTTGAGDAFVAGLLAALATLDTLPALDDLMPALTQAQACGALATTALGAMTALPDRQQLNHFLTASVV